MHTLASLASPTPTLLLPHSDNSGARVSNKRGRPVLGRGAAAARHSAQVRPVGQGRVRGLLPLQRAAAAHLLPLRGGLRGPLRDCYITGLARGRRASGRLGSMCQEERRGWGWSACWIFQWTG